MTLHCNGKCHALVPHSLHLFVGKDQYALRVGRDEATVWLPDGTLLQRAQPGAIAALKFDVKRALAR